jgi:hypothetical protein
MMFELIAAAVFAVFVSCLYPIVRGLFRDLEEIGPPPVSRLVTARRSVNRNLDSKKHNAAKRNRPAGGVGINPGSAIPRHGIYARVVSRFKSYRPHLGETNRGSGNLFAVAAFWKPCRTTPVGSRCATDCASITDWSRAASRRPAKSFAAKVRPDCAGRFFLDCLHPKCCAAAYSAFWSSP